MDQIVQTGRTVEEAEEQALAALGADRSEVEVEILNRGRQGFLGIGGELAEVRVTRIGAAPPAAPERDEPGAGDGQADEPDLDDEPAADDEPAPVLTITADTPAGTAVQAVQRILTAVGADVDVTLRSEHDELAGGPVIDINGPDSGLLIGRRGNTLHSLQFIVQSIVRQQFEEDVRVALDVEQYRQRREDSLREMADRVADRVAQTGRSITLEPMTPSDRRVIHLYLGERDGIRTESVGYGDARKVQIIPERD
ncbi:MAG: Jag N-terminal domain-containing protein [Chloroflexota bacterium]|nr:Jag N-terminal domain-containing protein [Chloroflexota bacterium]MDE2961965.1 Jag N-terminal domain-containing protein [Chloroflexota bacterium]